MKLFKVLVFALLIANISCNECVYTYEVSHTIVYKDGSGVDVMTVLEVPYKDAVPIGKAERMALKKADGSKEVSKVKLTNEPVLLKEDCK